MRFKELIGGTPGIIKFNFKPPAASMGASKFGKDIFQLADRTPHWEMREVIEIIETRPHIAAGLKQIVRFIIGDKIEIDSKDQATVEYMNNWIEKRKGFYSKVFDLTYLGIALGNSYLEPIYKEEKGKMIFDNFDIIPDPSRMYLNLNMGMKQEEDYWMYQIPLEVKNVGGQQPKFSKITYIKGGMLFKEHIYGLPFSRKHFDHLKIGWSRDGLYGRGYLASTIDDNKILREILKNIAIIARYRALNTKLITPTSENVELIEDDVEYIEQKLLTKRDEEHLVLNKALKVETLSNINEYDTMRDEIDFLRRDISSGLVPNFITAWDNEVNRACSRLDVTKVLTKNRGWVFHEEVKEDDEIALYDTSTEKMIFNKPKKLLIFDVDEDLCVSDSRIAKYYVTKEHTLLTKTDGRVEWKERKAGEVHDFEKLLFKTAAVYDGEEIEKISLPSVDILGYKTDEFDINADDMIAFTGLFLSEGCLHQPEVETNSSITISQSKNVNPEKVDEIDKLFKRLPFRVFRCEDSKGIIKWTFNNKQVKKWIKDNCGIRSINKKIPRELLRASVRQRKILFDWMMLGDGTDYERLSEKNNEENRYIYAIGSYTSTSKQLVDDFQELSVTLGYSAVINLSYKGEGNRNDCWRVNISKNTERSANASERRIEHYKGKVGCFETETGFYFIKVDDVIHVSGNTAGESKIPFELELASIEKDIINFLNISILERLKKQGAPIADDATFKFGQVVMESYESRVSVASSLYTQGLISFNEARKMSSLEPVEKGDKFAWEIQTSDGASIFGSLAGKAPPIKIASKFGEAYFHTQLNKKPRTKVCGNCSSFMPRKKYCNKNSWQCEEKDGCDRFEKRIIDTEIEEPEREPSSEGKNDS